MRRLFQGEEPKNKTVGLLLLIGGEYTIDNQGLILFSVEEPCQFQSCRIRGSRLLHDDTNLHYTPTLWKSQIPDISIIWTWTVLKPLRSLF